MLTPCYHLILLIELMPCHAFGVANLARASATATAATTAAAAATATMQMK